MIPKPLLQIEHADLEELVSAARPEGRTLDYKSALPGNADDDKRNLLYDVTAFANTLGGDIVYGIAEQTVEGKKTGVPEAVTGVDAATRERDEQRLEAIIRSGVDPRIPGVALRWVPHPTEGRNTLVLRIPKSLLAPHMVTFGGLSRFYGRGTSGNFPMDVREVRAAFEMSGDIASRMQAFRAERIAQVAADALLKLPGRGRMVLHVVPISSFEVGASVDLSVPPQLDLLSRI
jgi:hypothetical protein